LHTRYTDNNVISWLLEGDPAIRWQVKRDLLKEPNDACEEERRRIETEGWGKKLLDEQDEHHMWGKGLYNPKWISTHYTLMLLKRMGISPENEKSRKAVELLIEKGIYRDGGINFWKSMKHSETCVSGMILSIWAYFNIPDKRIDRLVSFLLDQQMADGGWNCQSFNGATHSSLHTTMSVLEGLWEYEKMHLEQCDSCRIARLKAHEFILLHELYKSDKTGKVIKSQFTRITFPPRWYYDILRALDYFRDCIAEKDDRFRDAIGLLRKKEKNGRWPMQNLHAGKMHFEIEKAGAPSRWNTLRALRVLHWWNSSIEIS
jgi:hypothetical protein